MRIIEIPAQPGFFAVTMILGTWMEATLGSFGSGNWWQVVFE
jgi:hypothetical protein